MIITDKRFYKHIRKRNTLKIFEDMINFQQPLSYVILKLPAS